MPLRTSHAHLARLGAFFLVFPLAARADVVYESLRMQRLPVFRWDRVWPGTPVLAGDTGRAWNRQVLQLLCHQDLSAEDTQFLGARVLDALSNTARTSLASPASTP